MITKTKPTKKRFTKRTTKATTKAKRPQTEQRAFERTKFVVAATVYPDRLSPDNLAHKVWITNISLGGVAFRTRRKYEPGTCCYVRVDAGIVKFDNPLKIIWCNRRDENTFEVGCELLPD
jgi:PilZ domain